MRASSRRTGMGAALVAAAGVVLACAGIQLARQSLSLGKVEQAVRDLNQTNRTAASRDLASMRRQLEENRGGHGVADLALAVETATERDRGDRAWVRERAQRVSVLAREIVAGAPLSNAGWCSLAEAMLLAGDPAASVRTALTGCYAVAPRSIAALGVRARTSLLAWGLLNAGERERAMADIASGLRDRSVGSWVIEELGRFAAVAPPDLQDRVSALVGQNAHASRWRFDEVVQEQRKRLGGT